MFVLLQHELGFAIQKTAGEWLEIRQSIPFNFYFIIDLL